MKYNKFFILLAFVFAMSLSVMADNDRVINLNQLPDKSQALLKSQFADKVPILVTADFDDFKVLFQSGEKVKFSKNGEWKEFDFKFSSVPPALIPENIKASVKQNFPQAKIIKLEREFGGFEVKLNNGIELKL
jgi:hypothetical protein